VPSTAPAWLVDGLRRIEEASTLDAPVGAVGAAADRLLASDRLDDALRGAWLGHALHPLLTDFPLGSWTSTTLLDLFGGRRSRPAATGLLAFGVAMALPTAASGVAEWRTGSPPERRVGVIHAAVNGTALALYASSLVARARRRQGVAVATSVLGGVVATVGGYLGGHLSLVRKVGTADPGFGR
jgi:uncharacterized membrane protein